MQRPADGMAAEAAAICIANIGMMLWRLRYDGIMLLLVRLIVARLHYSKTHLSRTLL